MQERLIQFTSKGHSEVHRYGAADMQEVFTDEERASLAAGETVERSRYGVATEVVDLQAFHQAWRWHALARLGGRKFELLRLLVEFHLDSDGADDDPPYDFALLEAMAAEDFGIETAPRD